MILVDSADRGVLVMNGHVSLGTDRHRQRSMPTPPFGQSLAVSLLPSSTALVSPPPTCGFVRFTHLSQGE